MINCVAWMTGGISLLCRGRWFYLARLGTWDEFGTILTPNCIATSARIMLDSAPQSKENVDTLVLVRGIEQRRTANCHMGNVRRVSWMQHLLYHHIFFVHCLRIRKFILAFHNSHPGHIPFVLLWEKWTGAKEMVCLFPANLLTQRANAHLCFEE